MLSPEQLAAWTNAAAIALARGRDADALSVLGCVFTQIGDTLTTMSTQKSLMENKKTNTGGS